MIILVWRTPVLKFKGIYFLFSYIIRLYIFSTQSAIHFSISIHLIIYLNLIICYVFILFLNSFTLFHGPPVTPLRPPRGPQFKNPWSMLYRCVYLLYLMFASWIKCIFIYIYTHVYFLHLFCNSFRLSRAAWWGAWLQKRLNPGVVHMIIYHEDCMSILWI